MTDVITNTSHLWYINSLIIKKMHRRDAFARSRWQRY